MEEETPLMLNKRESEYDSKPTKSMIIPKILLCLFVIIAVANSFFVVPPGTIGVVVTLGQVSAYSSGFHIKFPFLAQLINMTAKTQKLEAENDIPTREGLIVRLDTAV